MKLLCAYYKLDRFGQRCGRERCQEHIATALYKPLCGARMDTESYVWKSINGTPKYLCRTCKELSDQKQQDAHAALAAWNAGEPIR